MNDLYSYFEKIINDNKLVQSYLIGNTRFNDIKNELFRVLNDFFYKTNYNLEDNPDLYVLKNDDGIISKDDVKNLLRNISTTSQFNNIKVYIIDECEKLNDFSYNAILKTLEEPNPNIYAFLITKNIDSVKPTIVSRCQKIFISSEVKDSSFSDDIIKLGDEFINIIEEEKLKTISKHPEIYNKICDREIYKKMLVYIQNKYINNLNNMIENNLINEKEIEILSKKILVINNSINLSDNYLNKNLSIDRLIIEMWRCNNEDS